MNFQEIEIAGGVMIKFLDGESMVFKFANLQNALDFYHRAQRRADAFSVRFLDGDLQSVWNRGYGDSKHALPNTGI